MVNKDKINIGHNKVKELDGGVYDNLKLLRITLNKICEENEFVKPPELEQLNELFN